MKPGQAVDPKGESQSTPQESAPSEDALAPVAEVEEDPAFSSEPELLSWQASEYIEHAKPAAWYLALLLLAAGLAALMYFVFNEILSAVLVILMAVALIVYGRRSPRVLDYVLTETGIQVGSKFYPYTDFQGYALVEDNGWLTIEFDPLKRFMPRLSIFFDRDDVETIAGILDEYLPREIRPLDPIDRISRYLKF